ncbi:hypothetical protein, partial [Rudaea sp.]|uniref:hypothetical protein n=1 Tax=Rudaea sp. TaxID=2136325 RepID=UPI002ED06198
MIVSPFVPSKQFAGLFSCALAAMLTACSGSSPNSTAQSAPAQNPPPAQQQPPVPQQSMSVADL